MRGGFGACLCKKVSRYLLTRRNTVHWIRLTMSSKPSSDPLSVVIPGHRVVGAGGAVTGYAAGVGVKRALLELEAAVIAAGSAA